MLTPASESSSRRTHLIGDVLAIPAIWTMELGRWRKTGPRGAVLAAAPA